MKKEIHNTYSLEFKLQAVLLSGHPDIQSKEVAELLNIHPFMLSRWKKEMKDKRDMKDKAKEGKCGEGKCGEGKRGDEMKHEKSEKKGEKSEEGKCGA